MSMGEGHSVYGEHGSIFVKDNVSWIVDNMTNGTREMQEVIRVPQGTPHLQAFRYACEVGLALPLALFGIVGNVLAMVVLCRHKERLTTTVLLLALAGADTLILLSTISLRSSRYLFPTAHYHEAYHKMFRWVYPAMFFFRLTDTWLTVLMTVDRFIAVRHPLRASRLCSKPRTYFLILLVVVFSALLSLPRVFEWELVSFTDPVTNLTRTYFHQTSLTENTVYTCVYRILVFFLVMYLIPMSLLVALNVLLLKTLRHATLERASFQLTASQLSINYGNTRNVTVIVFTIVLVCIICNSCAMIGHILWSIPMAYKRLGPKLDIYRRYVSNISNVLVTLNSSVNFVIYCLCSRNFRTVLINTFHIERKWAAQLPENVALMKRCSSESEQTHITTHRSSIGTLKMDKCDLPRVLPKGYSDVMV